ncbi:MAG TPA: EamA family transporter [Hydrogenophaga sp.]|jgi:drug/metabolite transporter (DMT)-like permease|uniref:DMT family transporter n=1 Tax=Hydrogenophaga sp. TaxID=1904254 RepID=UPI0008C8A35A|nr:DMT family transporter [Hydrogenophaga sp.]MBU4180049.1 DMT family transporter [Gammaproteobacteria bacterium]OGA79205.1 MAG: multidrug DMT transporter permease [Burkholderiales bacterium GWE1_65_30]OGA92283.1 MAG: multidrug DMT transporter permease [Burkholderiales bacterium GWF1_66_17]OGB25661.1 MAG: multidrug DMT transporter permease [Burkholderiales bacterium RIFCSPHIGHO2_02_FULL_66_10]OGB35931.1 MAG: multidrug DMT transporter permease [Burkholderiales bacterium RIFCSPLOWO2_02_FULL_66_3
MTPVQRKDHLDTLAITLLVVCCAFWGFQQILIKFASREIPPLWQASIRMWGATALLWLWCQFRGVPLFQRDGTLKGGLLVGLLFAGEFVFIYLGLTHTSASRLTVFLYTSPFWVALLLPRFVHAEKLRRIQWIGLTLAFAAVAVAFSEAFLHGSSPGQWIGDTMGLAAGMLWGLTTLAIRTTRIATAAAEKSLFYQLGVTAAVTPLISIALGETWSFGYSALAWGSVFLQTAVGAFASYLTWMWMLRHYPATQMSTFTFLTPLFALIFGVVLLGEPLTLQLVLALLGVAAGIVLVSRKA